MLDKQYHFIGIGGIGMSALAHYLIQKGIKVTGSDLSSNYIVEGLKRAGVQVSQGQKAENIAKGMTVVYSTDISVDNPEYREAIRLNLPLLHRSVLLGLLMQHSSALLVAGTHGKTTTSSLLAHLLVQAGLEPSYAIGGVVSSLGGNGGYGKGTYFVAEADESDGSFLSYPGFGAIITNIDLDHMNYWQTEEALLDGFKKFVAQIRSPDHLFWCADDERLASSHFKGVSYGFDESADLHIENYLQLDWKLVFDFTFDDKKYLEVEIPLVGGHNVLNASAVFGMALRLGLPEEVIRTGLSLFRGVNRRAEMKGQSQGITVYDDYAHHPTEIFTTLRAIKKAIGKKKLIVAFQPHRYTRTKDCFDQFSHVFDPADELILTDIYAAGEPPIPGITTEALFARIKEKSKTSVHYVARSELTPYLSQHLNHDEILVTMGAGDVTKVGPEVLEQLKLRKI